MFVASDQDQKASSLLHYYYVVIRRFKVATAFVDVDGPYYIDERLEQNERVIRSLANRYTFEDSPDLGALVRPSDKHEPVQRWFHYREGYTVELCQQYIRPDDQLVLDPFCGFGSTLLAAKRAGVPSIGFDVNPLASFVASVKTRNYSSEDLDTLRKIQTAIVGLSESDEQAASPSIRILPKLFDSGILSALNACRQIIDREPDSKAKDLALLCWLSVLESVSNTYREGNGLKYRNRVRRGNSYTVVPIATWADSRFPADRVGFVSDRVSSAIDIALDDIEENESSHQPLVIEGDSSLLSRDVRAGSVTSAIFSPPYCNCFNYIKAYKLELWMGGFIKSYPQISGLTERGIRSRVESITAPAPASEHKSVEAIARLVSEGDLWSTALPSVVRGYFADMTRLLEETYRALAKGGRATIVVGNSALAGVLIPTDLLLADIAAKIGFEVDRVRGARHLTTSSQQRIRLLPLKSFLRESVIELSK